jgi:dihydrofolate synthase/folylpolyglutamate synthase
MPLADAWYCADLPTPRAATAVELEALCRESLPAGADGSRERLIQCHPNPRSALLAALDVADPADRIVVFGSFYTVGGVLEGGLPRRAAKHVG